MAFPPNFSNVWDNTFPPDTQAANQLGLDIRSLKTDVQQRFSLMSGTLANRPANLEAVFGGTGYGVLYFSIDTSQIFQWTGAVPAWVDVTASVIAVGGKASNAVPVVTNAPNIDGILLVLPANSLVIGSILSAHIEVFGGNNPLVNAGIDSIQVFFGTTPMTVGNFPGGGGSFKFEFDLNVLVTSAATQKASLTGTRYDFGAPASAAAISNLQAVNAVEPINAPITIKTRTIGGTLTTHNYITATWR